MSSFRASRCGISGEQSVIRTGSSPITLIFTRKFHSTNAPRIFIFMPLLLEGQAGEN
jgi:hypothetical protein